MYPSHVLQYLEEALNEEASKTAAEYTIENCLLTDSMNLTCDTLPASTAQLLGAVIIFDEGIRRRITAVDTPTKKLTWRKPLESFVISAGISASLTIKTTPMADSAIYVGGGIGTDNYITLMIDSISEEYIGLGLDYGSKQENLSGRIIARYTITESAQNYKLDYYDFLHWIVQIKDKLIEKFSTDNSCFVIMFENSNAIRLLDEVDKYNDTKTRYFQADMRFNIENIT